MKTFTVYIKIFNTKKKFIITKEGINSQAEAENYVLTTIIPESVFFYDAEKIKAETLKKEQETKDKVNKSFDKINESIDKTLEALGKAFNNFVEGEKKD